MVHVVVHILISDTIVYIAIDSLVFHSNAMKEDEPTKTSPEPATLDDGTTKEPDIPVSRQGKRTGSVKYKDDSRKRSSKQGGKAKQPSSPSARMQSPAPDSQSMLVMYCSTATCTYLYQATLNASINYYKR